MNTFKFIDFWVSVVLIILFTILSFLPITGYDDLPMIITGYFVVGAWQVISMIVHEILCWFTARRGRRRLYHWLTLISIVTMPAGSVWILVFLAPVMAIYYTWICYDEYFVKMRRPLSILK